MSTFQDVAMKKDTQSHNYCLMKHDATVELKKTQCNDGDFINKTHIFLLLLIAQARNLA